jgi:hypothetical protein
MLQIRAEQVEAFSAERRDEFLTRLAAHLREHFPEQLGGASDDELRAYGSACVARAAAHGLTHEQAVACYAHLPLVLGEDFEADPRYRPAVEALGDRSLDQDARAKFVVALGYNLTARDVWSTVVIPHAR